MQKILHILSQIPGKTGSGVFFENILYEFKKADYLQAAVLGLPLGERDYSHPCLSTITPVFFETRELPFPIPGMSDVMPYKSSRFSDLSFSDYQAYKMAFRQRLQEAIRAFQPDIILAHHLWILTATLCELISELDGRNKTPKVFAVCHGTDLRQLVLSPAHRPFVTAQCRKLNGVFCLHEAQKSEVSEAYLIPKDHITVIGNGFNGDLFFHGTTSLNDTDKEMVSALPPHKFHLIYGGKLSYSKGVRELLSAMDKLSTSHFQLTLAGGGSGAESDYLMEQIRIRHENINHVGVLSQKSLAALFQQGDIFILPSYYEGLPLVILEALAAGLFVVVNDLPGLKSWLPSAILDSGRIFFVKMPELIGIDMIKESEKESYVLALANAIETASRELKKAPPLDPSFTDALLAYTWASVFKRIEDLLIRA